MAEIPLTEREREWRERAQEALEADETWEPCADCGRYHPVGFDGECGDLEHRLPKKPEELVA